MSPEGLLSPPHERSTMYVIVEPAVMPDTIMLDRMMRERPISYTEAVTTRIALAAAARDRDAKLRARRAM